MEVTRSVIRFAVCTVVLSATEILYMLMEPLVVDSISINRRSCVLYDHELAGRSEGPTISRL